jgi:uncharacterized membrane protein
MRIATVAVLACVLSALSPASPVRASAAPPMVICNQMTERIEIVHGYHTTGVNDTPGSNVLTGPFVSKGFQIIEPGKCATFDNPFNARYMFFWAASHTTIDNHTPFTSNSSDGFCMPQIYRGPVVHSFTFEDENASPAACAASQFEGYANVWVAARPVDVLVSPTVNLYAF